MISIGIYGDSYADPGPDNEYIDPNLPLYQRKSDFKSWPMKLTKHYNVSHFGTGGTGIEYSYVNFLKTQHYFDKIIFVRSNPHRYTYFKSDIDPKYYFETPYEEKIKSLKHKFSLMFGNINQSYTTSENINRQKLSANEKSIIKNIHEVKMFSTETDHLIFEAISDSIKLRRPDTYFINAFSQHGDPCMFNVTRADYDALGSNQENVKTRFCHLSLCQNSQMFNIIMNVLSGKTQMTINDHLHKDVLSQYFTISKTKEEAGLL